LGISRSRLQDRLDRLVEHGILTKERAEGVAREEYRLTQKGRDVYPILMAIKDWGNAHMAPDGAPVLYEHGGCGGEAHVKLECVECQHELTARDIVPAAGPGFA
jgi:DNA-binding MarR family transcriptional regulator